MDAVISASVPTGQENDPFDELKNSLTYAQAGKLLDVSRTTLDAWRKTGRLRTIRLGGRRFIPLTSLRAMLRDE